MCTNQKGVKENPQEQRHYRRYAHFLPEVQQRAAEWAAEIITTHTGTAQVKEEKQVANLGRKK